MPTQTNLIPLRERQKIEPFFIIFLVLFTQLPSPFSRTLPNGNFFKRRCCKCFLIQFLNKNTQRPSGSDEKEKRKKNDKKFKGWKNLWDNCGPRVGRGWVGLCKKKNLWQWIVRAKLSLIMTSTPLMTFDKDELELMRFLSTQTRIYFCFAFFNWKCICVVDPRFFKIQIQKKSEMVQKGLSELTTPSNDVPSWIFFVA